MAHPALLVEGLTRIHPRKREPDLVAVDGMSFTGRAAALRRHDPARGTCAGRGLIRSPGEDAE